MAQDENDFYEIQLTNKQLVFYFMAGAAGLVLSFLAGVMVGKSAEPAPEGRPAVTRVQEERVVPEEPVKSEPPPPAESLTYARRLEGERGEERLEKPPTPAPVQATPRPEPSAAASAVEPTPAPARPGKRGKPTPAPRPRSTPTPVPATPAPPPSPAATPKPAVSPRPAESPSSAFTVQVGAYRDRSAADRIVKSLKKSGFPAYMTSAAAGFYQVRVGNFKTRAEAEPTLARLREKKFDPRVVPRN